MTTDTPLPLHEWLAIPPAVRGDYVEVYRLVVCHGEAGAIAGCRAWPMAKWRPWGLTPTRVNATVSVGLCEWIGETSQDLFLPFFDRNFEDAWKVQQESGAEGPKNRGKGSRPPSTPQARPPITDLRSEIRDLRSENKNGGGGGAEPPPPPLSLLGTQNGTEQIGAEERDRVIAALTRAMPRGEGFNPRTTPNLAELETYLPALAGVPADDLEPAYSWFCGKWGKNGRDKFWKASEWSLHVFVTQGLPAYREMKQAKVIEADIEARRLEDAKAAKAARRKAYIARLGDLLPDLEAEPPRPCHFHDCDSNHDVPPPKYAGLSEQCVYCVRTDLARLTSPPMLRLAAGGAS